MPDLLQKRSTLEILRAKAQARGSFWFYTAFFLFIIILGAYTGLFILNRGQKQSRDLLLEEVRFKEEELRPEVLKRIFTLEGQLKNVRTLLVQHVYASRIFEMLESSTLPQIRFTSFNFSADAQKIDLAGEAASYEVFSRQIGIFGQNPGIDKIEFGGLAFTSGGLVSFKLAIKINPRLITQKP